VKWMELRVHDEVKAIKTPTGFIPLYDNLKRLFKEVLNKEFSKELYDQIFTIKVPEWIAKLDRVEPIYKKTPGTPEELLTILAEQRTRLEELRIAKGDYVKPGEL
jgi:phosphoenolpyruvate carboxykinase (GTP)